MKKMMIVLALSLGSQVFAQEEKNSILDFADPRFNTEYSMPIANDTVLFVDAPVQVLGLDVEPHRVDNDPEGVFSFYTVGKFHFTEAKMNDGRVFFSVMRD